MSTPLTRPAPAPTAIAHSTITTGPYDCVASVVDHTDASATIAPTDRSMPPPMMTNVIPTLTTPMTAELTRIVVMFDRSRKLSLDHWPTAAMTTRTTTSPMLRTSLA